MKRNGKRLHPSEAQTNNPKRRLGSPQEDPDIADFITDEEELYEAQGLIFRLDQIVPTKE